MIVDGKPQGNRVSHRGKCPQVYVCGQGCVSGISKSLWLNHDSVL